MCNNTGSPTLPDYNNTIFTCNAGCNSRLKGGAADELTASAGGDAIVGVYDGHGQHGHHVSKFVKERLALELGRLGDGGSSTTTP